MRKERHEHILFSQIVEKIWNVIYLLNQKWKALLAGYYASEGHRLGNTQKLYCRQSLLQQDMGGMV